jgi:hypothetical protein
MANIYTIPQEVDKALAEYYACFDSETGELIVTEEQFADAETNLTELQNRSDDILKWYLEDRANHKADAKAIESEVERLAKRLDSEKKRTERADMLIDRMFSRIYDGKPVTIGTFTVSYRKSEAVKIDDETKLPTDFLRIPEPPKPAPDKTKIKEVLKAGQEVPGASIEVRQNLSIK